jgi:hypothetical protein
MFNQLRGFIEALRKRSRGLFFEDADRFNNRGPTLKSACGSVLSDHGFDRTIYFVLASFEPGLGPLAEPRFDAHFLPSRTSIPLSFVDGKPP